MNLAYRSKAFEAMNLLCSTCAIDSVPCKEHPPEEPPCYVIRMPGGVRAWGASPSCSVQSDQGPSEALWLQILAEGIALKGRWVLDGENGRGAF